MRELEVLGNGHFKLDFAECKEFSRVAEGYFQNQRLNHVRQPQHSS